ncbi:AraC family transcriptional regulator [Jeotgalibacillus sp. ET6]|uniref:AraC family transcriptional regulator n=1 Tax=Jeotgalibacillus sp. ET6 TaxID=3037260 RepID=UPI0024185827|nr:AraC family transcriptional regulator [Jeotgalibacillus sp. ET6]MDG5472442.1 AraC family transcriptional regulator [Jeotgalibacillus sp. ET6]
MLYEKDETHNSLAYHIPKEPLTEAVRITSIGCEKRISTDYYWDGRFRHNDHNTCIFQYTISGYGHFQTGENTYTIKPGEAFIVKVPGEHCYYLPEESPGWEFLFITLEGSKAQECWSQMIDQFGMVMKIDAASPLIFTLRKIYQFALRQGISDTFISSAQGYEFIMELYRYSLGMSSTNLNLPDDLREAVRFIETHYDQPLSLEDITKRAALSKYYFTNKFQKYLKTTPIQYLTKTRIKKAMELLITTNKPIQEIAVETGYTNANYFSKVFRKMIGMSPDSFRKDKRMIDFQHIIID